MRYGFCPQTCPTYILLGDENDSPRGRIDLMQAVLERGGAPDARTVAHLDRCLSSLACETTCAARIDYRELIDRGRAFIERHYRRPWRERWQSRPASARAADRLSRRLFAAARPARDGAAQSPATPGRIRITRNP